MGVGPNRWHSHEQSIEETRQRRLAGPLPSGLARQAVPNAGTPTGDATAKKSSVLVAVDAETSASAVRGPR